MTTARDYVPEKQHAKLTPGRALRIARELQELSQSELARRAGIAPSAISAFESGAQEMGLKRVKVLADVLGIHPAVLAFPEYEAPSKKPQASMHTAVTRTAQGGRAGVAKAKAAKTVAARRRAVHARSA